MKGKLAGEDIFDRLDQQALTGGLMPTTDRLMQGGAFFKGRLWDDVCAWATKLHEGITSSDADARQCSLDLEFAFGKVITAPLAENIRLVKTTLVVRDEQTDSIIAADAWLDRVVEWRRCIIYLASLGDPEALGQLCGLIATSLKGWPQNEYGYQAHIEVLLGAASFIPGIPPAERGSLSPAYFRLVGRQIINERGPLHG